MSDQVAEDQGKHRITYREFNRRINAVRVCEEKGEWAGLAMPMEGERLVLEPRYPYQETATMFNKETEPDPDEERYEVINSWWSERLRTNVMLAREKKADGTSKIVWFAQGSTQVNTLLRTMGCSMVWPLEAERKALDKLAELITHHAFVTYLLTGSFLETSKRSKVTYMFRKLRPTLAIRPNEDASRVLCGLCLHPIGYYDDSWAGVMCPTDEVVAHLCLMRGSEEKFWANANQHHPSHPACGV